MTAKKRIVGHSAPNARPRPPDAQQLLDDLASVDAALIRAAIELRAYGLHELADVVCGEIGHLRQVHTAARVWLCGAVRAVEEVTP